MKYHDLKRSEKKRLVLDLIRTIRLSKRLTQTDMSLYLGMMPSAYNRIESGNRKLIAEEFIQILELESPNLLPPEIQEIIEGDS